MLPPPRGRRRRRPRPFHRGGCAPSRSRPGARLLPPWNSGSRRPARVPRSASVSPCTDFPARARSRKVGGVARTGASPVKTAAKWLAALALALAAQAAAAQDKVVYHMDGGLPQASKGLRHIYNHLEADPKVKIVVVAHAEGVDFLMEGAKDRLGPFDARVQDLMSQGVKFQVCEITLRNNKLKKEQFIIGVDFVPSGVAQITHLQQKEGYAYLKP